jgi:hypothetical protein
MELVSCHLSGDWSFEIVARFLKKFLDTCRYISSGFNRMGGGFRMLVSLVPKLRLNGSVPTRYAPTYAIIAIITYTRTTVPAPLFLNKHMK